MPKIMIILILVAGCVPPSLSETIKQLTAPGASGFPDIMGGGLQAEPTPSPSVSVPVPDVLHTGPSRLP